MKTELDLGKMPPQAVELEEAVLGAIMLEKDVADSIFEILKVESFYKTPHGIIYKACMNVGKRNEPIDILTVTQELKRTGQLDNVGGAYYITQLTNRVASAANAEFHARIVAQKYIQREVIRITSESLVKAYEANTDVFDLLDGLSFALTTINNSFFFGKQIKTREIIDNTAAAVQKAKDNNGVLGPSTGLDDLDKILCGLRTPDVMVIAGRPAMGKCLGKGTKIIMFDGSLKNVEDIIVGDKLMGPDSAPRNVLSLARGKEQMYWVQQNKGVDYRVNESHILSLKQSGEVNTGSVTNISVSDYLKKSQRFRNRQKGYKVEIDFFEKKLPLEPYFIGIWLGDGSTGKVEITNPEPEIEEYLNCYAKKLGLQVTKYFTSANCPCLSITKGYCGRAEEYNVTTVMRNIGILNNKHIPDDYLLNSKENRMLLLAGLLDTDGYFDKTNHGFEITQTRKDFAEQIKFLCDTLGFKTSITQKTATIKSIGFVGIVYRIRISGDIHNIPIKVTRRKPNRERKNRTDWRVTGIMVKKDIIDDYYGFEIDGDRLFLLEDCTVTHNTAAVLCITKALAIAQNLPVQIFSLEMSSQQLMLRLLSDLAEIDNRVLSTGKLSVTEQSAFEAAQRNIPDHLYIDDSPAITIQYFESVVRKKVLQGVKYFIIDYLQLMRLTEKDAKGKNREQQIAFLTGEIKRIAKKYDIWICELSQISRDCEDRDPPRPMLSDLRESGAIEQDADIVMFLYRPEYYNIEFIKSGRSSRRVAELIISKHRNGPVDSVITKFIGEYTRFENDEPKKTDSMDDVEKTPELVF